MTLTVSEI